MRQQARGWGKRQKASDRERASGFRGILIEVVTTKTDIDGKFPLIKAYKLTRCWCTSRSRPRIRTRSQWFR
jgi:hypothetical protein